jgi:hypothetical protein
MFFVNGCIAVWCLSVQLILKCEFSSSQLILLSVSIKYHLRPGV